MKRPKQKCWFCRIGRKTNYKIGYDDNCHVSCVHKASKDNTKPELQQIAWRILIRARQKSLMRKEVPPVLRIPAPMTYNDFDQILKDNGVTCGCNKLPHEHNCTISNIIAAMQQVHQEAEDRANRLLLGTFQ